MKSEFKIHADIQCYIDTTVGNIKQTITFELSDKDTIAISIENVNTKDDVILQEANTITNREHFNSVVKWLTEKGFIDGFDAGRFSLNE